MRMAHKHQVEQLSIEKHRLYLSLTALSILWPILTIDRTQIHFAQRLYGCVRIIGTQM